MTILIKTHKTPLDSKNELLRVFEFQLKLNLKSCSSFEFQFKLDSKSYSSFTPKLELDSTQNFEIKTRNDLITIIHNLYFVCFVSGEVERFIGNSSVVDNFKLLVRDENFLLVGAM